MVETDDQRVSSAEAGEMARVFAEHSRYVRRTLRQFGVSFPDSDDAVQQVFLVVHRRFSDYVRIPFKRTWLFSVSRLVARNYHRGLKRADAHQRWLMDPPYVDPEEVLMHREASRLVSGFLERLDE